MAVRAAVDVGGTFTDAVLVTDDGELVTAKTPTTAEQSEGVFDALKKACRQAAVDPASIEEFTHATTVAVNALLERDGARTALITTAGFRDVLEIGRQDRPALYDLDAEKPDPLVPRSRRYELAERATPEGVSQPVDPADVRELVDGLDDVESVAVVFLHAYATPDNETRAATVLREALDAPVSVSHEVLGEFREFERTATTAVDAYVAPIVDDYLGRLLDRADRAGVPEPHVMQSNGGVAPVETVRDRPVTTTLSGPAAGVVGAGQAARAATEPLDGVVTFDMGGTSSDVSVVRGEDVERTTETTVGGVPIGLPMVDVNTVGSGGGSIAWVDAGGALRVGPESAGADPGPACYDRGGTDPTVTDAAVVLGYVGPETSLGGELSLSVDAAEAALSELANEAGLSSARAAARGVYRVANATMARAIREVTVERGDDPRSFGLVAFGGAGPMHAAAVADDLGIDVVVVPLASGVLSAYGLLGADERADRARTHRTPLARADAATIEAIFDELETEARGNVRGAASAERAADLRYEGQSFELTVPVAGTFDRDALRERFHDDHQRAYGYRTDDPVELVSLRVTARSERTTPETDYDPSGAARLGRREAVFGDDTREASVYDRRSIPAGESIAGPAIFEDDESTTVVPPEWVAAVDPDGTVRLERGDGA